MGYEGLIADNYDVKFEVSKMDRTNWYNQRTTGTFYGGAGTNASSPSETLDVLAQVAFAADENNYLVAGLNQRNTELNREVYFLSNWRDEDSKTTISDGVNGKSTNSSVFLQDEISVGESLVVYAGGRYDKWKTEGSNFNKVGTGAYSNVFEKRTDSAFSPKLSLVYLPTKDITLRASSGKSFRAPDNYELYGTLYCCSKYYLSNPNLKPETALSNEIGAEWRVNPKFKTAVSYYQTTLKDMIFGKTIDATHVQKENAGEAQVKGLELTASTELSPWLNLDLSYSKTDSEIIKNDVAPATVGKQLTQTPETMWSATLSSQYESWTGLIETKYTGKVFNTQENTDIAEGVFGSHQSYTMTNMKVGYKFNNTIKGNVAINNVTDEKVYQYYLLPGRNATVELVLTF
ncbi:MAG: TonB-dependent receptor [Arcobacteraceae bacterium]|nr:TonB-dependent receptor [Arcobacteraceae bacterium]